MTYKELVYMTLDALKIHSDDSKFTEDHVIFLLNKYRAFVLNQKYSKPYDSIGEANFQTKDIEMNAESGFGDIIFISLSKIPNTLKISIPDIVIEGINDKTYITEESKDQATKILKNKEIIFVNNKRFKYVGNNRYLNNIIYATIKEDGYMYHTKLFINNVPIILNLKIRAIFEDPIITGDILENDFPLEASLVPNVLELVMKDLTNGLYKPSDNTNDAQDALSDLAGFLRRNMKSQFQKQIDE